MSRSGLYARGKRHRGPRGPPLRKFYRSLFRIHIIGRKNHGKTTLVVELISFLKQRGLSVAAVKHTHHAHELDTPGKDSFRHRQAGAEVVGIVAQNLSAAFWPTPPEGSPGLDRYAQFAALMGDCDIVLVEGDQSAQAPRIEVWRAAIGSPPLAQQDATITALVTDDPAPVDCPVYPRSDLAALVDAILQLRGDLTTEDTRTGEDL